MLFLLRFSPFLLRFFPFPQRFSLFPLLAAPLAALQLLAAYLLFWFYAAGVEEIVFRGMVVREIAARLGWIRAWLIGGAFFGLIHYQPGYGALGALWLLIGGILVSGLFVALYVRGRTLWLPIGFHLGWNFCMTNLIGAPMSGRESSAGLLRTSVEGHTLLTGGDFGIEIGAGLGEFAGKLWRVGLMGHASRPGNVFLFLSALETVLKGQGAQVKAGALAAASRIYEQA